MSNSCWLSILSAVLLSGSLQPCFRCSWASTSRLTLSNDGWQKRSVKGLYEVSAEKERLRFAKASLRTMPAAKINLSWIRHWHDFVHDSRPMNSDKAVSCRLHTDSLSLATTPPSFFRSAAQVGLSGHFWYIYLPRKYTSPESYHGSLDEFFQAVEHLSDDEIVSRHAFWA